jgi:hypothetical protein
MVTSDLLFGAWVAGFVTTKSPGSGASSSKVTTMPVSFQPARKERMRISYRLRSMMASAALWTVSKTVGLAKKHLVLVSAYLVPES